MTDWEDWFETNSGCVFGTVTSTSNDTSGSRHLLSMIRCLRSRTSALRTVPVICATVEEVVYNIAFH